MTNPADRGAAQAYHGEYDGYPGLVWYAEVREVLGADLKPGDWLDSPDHGGARRIYQAEPVNPATNKRRVTFSQFYDDDHETVAADVLYPVVNPDSQVAPDGTPLRFEIDAGDEFDDFDDFDDFDGLGDPGDLRE